MGVSAITNEGRDFHMKEYDALRAEILAHSASVITLAQYAVAASAAVYVFLLVSKPEGRLRVAPKVLSLAGFIPVMFAVFGGMLSNQQHRRMREIGCYLRLLEARFALPGLGWESLLHVREGREHERSWLGLYGAWRCFWIAFTLVTLGMGFVAPVVAFLHPAPQAGAAAASRPGAGR